MRKQSQSTCNITLVVTYHLLCHILLVGIKSLVLPTVSGRISSKDVSTRNWGPEGAIYKATASGGHHTGGPGNILTASSPLLEVTTGSREKYPPLGLQLGLDTATRARWLGCEHPKATKPDISTQGNFTLIRDRSDRW